VKRFLDGSVEQEGSINYSDLMTEEQIARGQRYSDQYWTRRAEVDAAYKEEWDYLQRLYEGKRDPVGDDPDFPNSFIPVITPTVEGQVASMLESQIDFFHVTNNPGHKAFMRQLDAASEYYRRKSRFKEHLKDFARYYDLLGNCWITISWEDSISNNPTKPKGYPRISVPPVLSVLVDGTIKDAKDMQYAQYIIREIGYVPIEWAIQEYGEKYANAIALGINRIEGEDMDLSYEDTDTFMLLHYWTRDRKTNNLQLIEMDVNGLILRDSSVDNPDSPFFKYVDNEYPFAVARMIPQLGKFYGFGDGAILMKIQETINNLTDELELAARFSAQSKLAVDPKADMAGDQLTTNPADPIYCEMPNENIKVIEAKGINQVVPQMIEFLLREAQRITRFHDIMTGNMAGSSATATQVNSQMMQGSVGIKDKKSDIAEVMKWADMYALKLCLEKWDKPFWARVGKHDTSYVDVQSIERVPNSTPMTTDTLDQLLDEAIQGRKPMFTQIDFETATDSDGNYILTDLDFDTEVVIGDAVPRGRTDMYNILLGLAQIQVQNADGSVGPLVSGDFLKEALEEVLGMKLQTDEERVSGLKQNAQVVPQSVTGQNPIGDQGVVQRPQNMVQAPPDNLASRPGLPGADQRGQV
jgi:hypothetical protein